MLNKPYITKIHIVLEIIAYVIAFVTLVGMLIYCVTHPGLVPSDFGTGIGEGVESVYRLLILPAGMIIGCVGMTLAIHVGTFRWYRIPFRLKPGKNDIVMYYLTMGTAVSIVIILAGVSLLSFLLMLGKGAYMNAVLIGTMVLVVPSTLISVVLAWRANSK